MTPAHDLLRQTHNRPDAMAFVSNGEVWSYRRLAGDVERLAQALLARGLQPGDRVALHMANLPELVAAYYACFRVGAIAAPLNNRFKTAELRPLLKRLQPAFYLGQSELYPQMAPIEAEILPTNARFVVGNVDDGQALPWKSLFERQAAGGVTRQPDYTAPALLLTTSGTTGEPKLVTHTPATLSAIIDVFQHLELDSGRIAINALPMVHIAGLVTFLACIRFGAPTVLLERFDADSVLDAIARHRCSWMLGLPFMFAGMMTRQRVHRRDVDTLPFLCSTGDVCPLELQEAYLEDFGVPLRSFLGSTEAGAFLHGLQVGPACRIPPGMEIRLVDDRGALVRQGEVGELLVRGPTVTPGYWTGSGRIDDPKRDGWFPTGDLMRQEGCDELWFVARKKDLIVRGGSNISPIEVASVLRTHPAVRDVAVFGVPDEVLGQRVAALVQLVNGVGADAVRDIAAAAKAKLADYKVPERWKVVSEVPKNALGKVDRKALLAIILE